MQVGGRLLQVLRRSKAGNTFEITVEGGFGVKPTIEGEGKQRIFFAFWQCHQAFKLLHSQSVHVVVKCLPLKSSDSLRQVVWMNVQCFG